jgi:hypothetical protein
MSAKQSRIGKDKGGCMNARDRKMQDTLYCMRKGKIVTTKADCVRCELRDKY